MASILYIVYVSFEGKRHLSFVILGLVISELALV